MLHEIVLPATKPETEWVRGRALQKMSPQRDHSRLQGMLNSALMQWPKVAARLDRSGAFASRRSEMRRPLVPDVAYVSNERLRPLSYEEPQVPPLSPDVAVEILSPDDRRIDIDDKISTYLRAGSSLVIVVDAIEHASLPGFRYSVADLFGALRRG